MHAAIAASLIRLLQAGIIRRRVIMTVESIYRISPDSQN